MLLQLIGTPSEAELGFLNENAKRYIRQLPQYQRQSFAEKFPHVHPAAIDLVEKMLTFDPRLRITGEWMYCTVISFVGGYLIALLDKRSPTNSLGGGSCWPICTWHNLLFFTPSWVLPIPRFSGGCGKNVIKAMTSTTLLNMVLKYITKVRWVVQKWKISSFFQGGCSSYVVPWPFLTFSYVSTFPFSADSRGWKNPTRISERGECNCWKEKRKFDLTCSEMNGMCSTWP